LSIFECPFGIFKLFSGLSIFECTFGIFKLLQKRV
jgi:hypothetical protein